MQLETMREIVVLQSFCTRRLRPKTQAQPGSPGACRLWAKPPHRAKPGVVSPELAPVIVFASPDNSVFFPSVRRILCLFLLSPDLSTYIFASFARILSLRLMTASLYLHLSSSFPLTNLLSFSRPSLPTFARLYCLSPGLTPCILHLSPGFA